MPNGGPDLKLCTHEGSAALDENLGRCLIAATAVARSIAAHRVNESVVSQRNRRRATRWREARSDDLVVQRGIKNTPFLPCATTLGGPRSLR